MPRVRPNNWTETPDPDDDDAASELKGATRHQWPNPAENWPGDRPPHQRFTPPGSPAAAPRHAGRLARRISSCSCFATEHVALRWRVLHPKTVRKNVLWSRFSSDPAQLGGALHKCYRTVSVAADLPVAPFTCR